MMRGVAARAMNRAALLWGFAEAVVFFVVPDVLLTLIAQRRGFRAAAIATAFAVLGACLGGALMWRLGRDHQAAVVALLDWLPAISPRMIADAGPVLALEPFHALLDGAFSGVPYKVFAALAANAGISLAPFLLITIPARAARFLLASAATALLDRLLARWIAKRIRTLLLAGFWVLFYVVYWAVMPN
jgi:membrane protein YqaA with SNARE-associated domain